MKKKDIERATQALWSWKKGLLRFGECSIDRNPGPKRHFARDDLPVAEKDLPVVVLHDLIGLFAEGDRTYNSEDCKALDVVATKLVELTQALSNAGSSPPDEVVDTTTLKREHPYGFKRNTFAFQELDVINKAAYWDYQRERIYVKSHANLKRTPRPGKRPRQVIAPNKTIACAPPRLCPRCALRKVDQLWFRRRLLTTRLQ